MESHLFSLLTETGVDEQVARQLISSFGVDVVQRQVRAFHDRLMVESEKGRPVENPAGFLVASIRGDWSAPDVE